MSLSEGSDRVVKYRHFFPARAAANKVWRASTVFPEPGSPEITDTDPVGKPPRMIWSSVSTLVGRRGSVIGGSIWTSVITPPAHRDRCRRAPGPAGAVAARWGP